MKTTGLMLLATMTLLACGPDETISGYADENATYVLTSINDTAFSARATIGFPTEGKVRGAGPCNIFNAAQTAPYPWFAIGPIASTRRACPDLDLEQVLFMTLGQMRFAEVVGDVLILSGDEDALMVFQAE